MEVLTTMLEGDHVADGTRRGTDMTLLAIKPQEGFSELTAELSAHIRTTPPIDPRRPVLMPGDREHQQYDAATQVSLPRASWGQLQRAAEAAGVAMPRPLERAG